MRRLEWCCFAAAGLGCWYLTIRILTGLYVQLFHAALPAGLP